MPDDIPQFNTGVILGSGTKHLWVGGTIPFEEVLPSGDWRPYLPIGEKQKDAVETMACATFSCMNVLEIQSKQQSGVEPNWSDRFIAKMSGTTSQGNYLDKVADTVRLIGVVNESEWPKPADYTWDSYYQNIPQEVINKAQKLNVAYESIVASWSELRYHLRQSPVQIIITNTNPRHAVTLVHLDGNTAYYFDHYTPFLRTIHVSNIYNYALKIVLKATMSNTQFVHKAGTNEYGFYVPATSEEAIKDKAQNYGVAIEKPDGAIDFSRAKEVSGL